MPQPQKTGIKEGISRHSALENLAPRHTSLKGEENTGKASETQDLAQLWHPCVPLSAFSRLNEAQNLFYERIMMMIMLCTSKAASLIQSERLTNETSQTCAS